MTNVQSGRAEINGTQLYYEMRGSGEALTLVHAGVADHRMWRPQVAAFAERYRVVTYDLRGLGQSPPVDAPYSHIDDLHALLGFLGIERTALLGCSRGGKLTIDYALAHPEQVTALIPVCSGVSGLQLEGEPPRQWQEVLESFEAGDLERTSELEVQIWVDGPQRGPDAVDPAIRDLVREMNLLALRWEKTGLGSEQEPERPAHDRLGEITVPTLVIIGDLDQPAVVQAGDLIWRGIPGAQRVVMTGTAHLPNLERPDEFNERVLHFLGALPR
jgi:pimeloyl-ACP methyl ester carboxylesterase